MISVTLQKSFVFFKISFQATSRGISRPTPRLAPDWGCVLLTGDQIFLSWMTTVFFFVNYDYPVMKKTEWVESCDFLDVDCCIFFDSLETNLYCNSQLPPLTYLDGHPTYQVVIATGVISRRHVKLQKCMILSRWLRHFAICGMVLSVSNNPIPCISVRYTVYDRYDWWYLQFSWSRYIQPMNYTTIFVPPVEPQICRGKRKRVLQSKD